MVNETADDACEEPTVRNASAFEAPAPSDVVPSS